MRRDVFQAIADPTRREIIHLLSGSSLNINSVSQHFTVSRAAVYKHLKILSDCGLIEVRKQGRERFCQVKFERISEVSAWADQYRKFWENKLDALGEHLTSMQEGLPKHIKKKK